LGKDWYNADGLDAHGLNVKALKEALEAIRAGGTPDIPDDPNPPPPPPPPPPPVPGNGSTLDAKGVLHFFDQKLPIELMGIITNPTNSVSAPNWLAVIMDVAAILSALRARDWVAVVAAVEKLLKDIGGTFSADDRHNLAAALMASADTMPLTNGTEK